jgi:hypothetical protein
MRPQLGAVRAPRVAAVLAATILLLAIAAPAAAHRPTVEVVLRGSFTCEPLTSGDSTSFVEAVTDEFGGYIAFTIWDAAAIPFDDPPLIETVGWSDVVLTEVSLTATLQLGHFDEATGDPVVEETATLSATLSVIDTLPVDDLYQDGNVRTHETGTLSRLLVDATVTTESYGTITREDCTGERTNLLIARTSPDAVRFGFGGIAVGCEVATEGLTASFFIGDDGYAFAGILTDALEAAGDGQGRLSRRGGSASIPLWTPDGDPAGTADAQFTLSVVGSTTSRLLFSWGWQKATYETYAVSGTLTFPGGITIDMSDCTGDSLSLTALSSSPNGPKPGGKPPVNDAPDGALPLVPGTRSQVQTGGAVPEAEAAASCAEMVHTVWYEVSGTGDQVTIDTAGSHLDTVIVVYDDAWQEIACVDDVLFDGVPPFVRITQAKVTFETTVGATYHVQIGGFAGPTEFGRIMLTVD